MFVQTTIRGKACNWRIGFGYTTEVKMVVRYEVLSIQFTIIFMVHFKARYKIVFSIYIHVYDSL